MLHLYIHTLDVYDTNCRLSNKLSILYILQLSNNKYTLYNYHIYRDDISSHCIEKEICRSFYLKYARKEL